LDKKPAAYAEWCLYSPGSLWVNKTYFDRFEPDYKLWHFAKEIVKYSLNGKAEQLTQKFTQSF
jgi:hypothetical protein